MIEFDPKVLVRDGDTAPPVTQEPAYETPSIEMVLTADELEHEALYGGAGAISLC